MTTTNPQRLYLLAAQFGEWLAAINFSKRTQVGYLHNVELFIDWLLANTTVSQINQVTAQDLHQYQIALYNFTPPKAVQTGKHRLAPGTQLLRLIAVRKFFSWLVKTQQIAHNPTSSLQLPRKRETLPTNTLSRNEVSRLLQATPMDNPRDLRDRTIIEILYATAIRRSELLALTLYDLDLAQQTLTIRLAKHDSDRVIPLTSSIIEILQHYLTDSRPYFTKEPTQTYLFISTRSGGPLDPDDILRIVAKATKRAGILKHVTPHTLRHSLASHLLKNQVDIRQVQQILGHKLLSSTQVYTRVEVSDLHALLQRYHPREQFPSS